LSELTPAHRELNKLRTQINWTPEGNSLSTPHCPLCDDMRVIVTAEGAKPCECAAAVQLAKRIALAGIPPRYEHSCFENYETRHPRADQSLASALVYARAFADTFLTGEKGRGLLLHGSLGTGKTHLAVSVIRELITRYGIRCLFIDQAMLLKELQFTYNRSSQTSEESVLSGPFEKPVIVLDDLGIMKFNDWAAWTLGLILNHRYNQCLSTIVTTNYPARPSTLTELAGLTETERELRKATTQETLGDRVTDRVFSRFQETYLFVELRGADFRSTIKKARA
jgi:DNA replication protein DnaC